TALERVPYRPLGRPPSVGENPAARLLPSIGRLMLPAMEQRTITRWTLIICVALVIAFFIQGWGFIRANSQTHDEAVHLTAGYSYLVTHDFRLNPEHPPLLKEWAAL